MTPLYEKFVQGMWIALLLILTLMYMGTALIIIGGIAFAALTIYLFHRGWREENEPDDDQWPHGKDLKGGGK